MTKPKDPAGAERWREAKNERQRIPKGRLTVDPPRRARLYNDAFPDRPPLASTDEWVVGTWAIGACWKNTNPLYGAYPRGYLERVHSMFPEAFRILHAFSGGLRHADAYCLASRDDAPDSPYIELVDMHGPNQSRYPTWRGDLLEYCERRTNGSFFDLVLADPPYSAEDAKRYECPPPNRGRIMRALARVTRPGGNLVWLDQVWPMHRKNEWRTWGQVGLVRSTNHRVRLVSFFERMP